MYLFLTVQINRRTTVGLVTTYCAYGTE